jgi:hypothetical protein
VIDLTREVFEARKIIRNLGYFNLNDQQLHTMTNKKSEIQPHFSNFLEQCVLNRKKYYASLCEQATCKIVSILQDESMETMDSKTLLKRIRQKIKTLPETIQPYYTKECRKERTIDQLQELSLVIDEEIRDWDARENDFL